MESCIDIIKAQLKALKPSFVSKKPHFNFITTHYFYVLGLVFLGSVLIYAPGKHNLAYIDALFFSAGAATQAGLNTVDVNLLTTYQQAVIFCIAGIANPITINSFVVVLRLYWFEKRFQHIVHEARMRRRTISKSKSKTRPDLSRFEHGVNGRNITVMHNGIRSRVANDGTLLGPMAPAASDGPAHGTSNRVATTGQTPTKRGRSNTFEPRHTFSEPLERRPTEIKFAPTVKRSDGLEDDATKLPPRLSDAEHIAILERQRQNDEEVLRIPGPRDVERGILPSRVTLSETDTEDDEDEPGSSSHRQTNGTNTPGSRRMTRFSRLNGSSTSQSPTSPGSPALEKSPRNSLDSNASMRITNLLDSAGDQKYTDANGSSDDERRQPRLTQAITIQEPEKPSLPEELNERVYAAAGVLSAFRPRVSHLRANKAESIHEVQEEPLQRPSTARLMRRQTLNNLKTIKTAFTRDKNEAPAPYLSWEPTLGRNSTFIGLSEEQREELGGIEYRSLKTLAMVLFSYYWGFWLLGVVCLLPWIMKSKTYGPIVDAASQNRVWWGFFTPHSAFMDLGFTLTPDSMDSFNQAVFPLLLMSFLIVIGNTGFPVMLRFVIWVGSIVVPRGSGLYEELKFLLDHPRRCFTLLFPSGATWWLFWLLVALNGIDLLFFCVLDLGNGPIFALPPGIRVLDGLFQAFSTRTAGFSCVNLADVHPAVQASYMIMMYISVFPIAISVRRTNVYEEKSLGVYNQGDMDDPANGTDLEYVGAHLRRQLSFDLWFLSVGFFILTISEGGRLQRNEFSMFAVLFEVVSAYGTVGLSLGFSDGNASLCSQFSVVGKLVIIAMMVRGRHRGLPYGLDRAILLPSESLNAKEAAAEVEALGRSGGASGGWGGSGFGGTGGGTVNSIGGSTAMSPTTMRRGSMTSLGTRTGTMRASSTNRERRRSRNSVDRNNILTNMMHPGPAVLPGNPLVPPVLRRSFSEVAVDDSTPATTTGFEAAGTTSKVHYSAA